MSWKRKDKIKLARHLTIKNNAITNKRFFKNNVYTQKIIYNLYTGAEFSDAIYKFTKAIILMFCRMSFIIWQTFNTREHHPCTWWWPLDIRFINNMIISRKLFDRQGITLWTSCSYFHPHLLSPCLVFFIFSFALPLVTPVTLNTKLSFGDFYNKRQLLRSQYTQITNWHVEKLLNSILLYNFSSF